jgi:hypothetical protein
MMSLVLMAAYSTFLMSCLAVQRQELPFRDLQGLLNDGNYRLFIERESHRYDMFRVR